VNPLVAACLDIYPVPRPQPWMLNITLQLNLSLGHGRVILRLNRTLVPVAQRKFAAQYLSSVDVTHASELEACQIAKRGTRFQGGKDREAARGTKSARKSAAQVLRRS